MQCCLFLKASSQLGCDLTLVKWMFTRLFPHKLILSPFIINTYLCVEKRFQKHIHISCFINLSVYLRVDSWFPILFNGL